MPTCMWCNKDRKDSGVPTYRRCNKNRKDSGVPTCMWCNKNREDSEVCLPACSAIRTERTHRSDKPFVWCSDSRVALSGVPGLRLLHVPLQHYCVHGNTFSWYPLFSQSFAMGATEYLAV